MNQNRILPLVGPALLVYLLADVLREGGGIDGVGAFVAVVALSAVLSPFWLSRYLALDEPGIRRVGALGSMSGLALVTHAGVGMSSLLVSIASAVFVCAASVLVLDLALVVPEEPRSLARARPSAYALALVAGALGVIAHLPAIHFRGNLYIAPSALFSYAPMVYAVGAMLLAVLVRIVRARRQAGAFAASNSWGLIGTWPGLALMLLVTLGTRLDILPADSPWPRLAAASSVLFLLYGHVALVDPSRRIEAAAATRNAVAWTITVVLTSSLVLVLAQYVPADPITAAVSAAGVIAFATLVRTLVTPVVRRLLAPFGGKLLDALALIRVRMESASTLEALASALLPPLREACGDEASEPVLYLLEPSLALRIDAAGLARTSPEHVSEELVRKLGEKLGEVIVFADLDAQVVRRPEIRPLHETLARHDALAVVPLVCDGNLEGAFVVPNGVRRKPPALEELTALLALAGAVAPRVAVFGEALRARDRLTRVAADHDRVEQRVDVLLEENDRLKEEARALRAGRGWGGIAETVIAYAPASRTLERRIADVAPSDAPVLLVAEPGSHVDRVGRRIHRASGRGEGPFVLGDCAAMPADELEGALFGSESQSGWLRLAHGGSLLLTDFPALPIAVQRSLATALATRSAIPAGGSSAYGVDVRVIATARAPLSVLVERQAAEEDFARWLGQVEIDVPPLRDRAEDLPSLVLLAIDRACRILGRPSVGVGQDAMDVLVAYAWPGNVRELELVMQLAVDAASGETIEAVHLPPLAGVVEPAPAVPETLGGTLADVERRALERALEKARGNKTVAAKSLGLARTTFLDKLRRYGLEPSVES